ncbi:MBL fold metallo-hydrolase [Halorientalis pallida]|uniref:MBL fold metallo-hydrolase n=1 Tax=Halorientalis pallida TaxID=2479928 RepID=A0A498KQH2_9EURY|nr:MBL fold metallo-hydrolase [Halorientalis pallida]RXK46357.1 MBL fold metallo-hydrolase [Halorientalis pallida]
MSDYPEPDVAVDSRSPDWLAGRLAAGDPVRLLDVRNRDEFEDWQITGPSVEASLIPYMQWLQAEVQDAVADRAEEIGGDGPITVVCGKGEASAYVAGLLTEAGLDAHNLDEGMEGWARVARTVELPCDAATVLQFQRPASGCLSYLVVAGDEAAVIDPLRAFSDRYVAATTERDAEITTVVDTHVHADHVSGLRELADETGATAVLPRLSHQRGVEYDVETIIDGEEIETGDATLRAVHLPGHTTGTTGFAVGDVLLSGDSLFLESVARPDLQRGEGGAEALAAQLYESLIERLADFDDDTLVAPGHYSEGTDPDADGAFAANLGDLRERLPVFDMDRTAFTARIVRDMPPQPDNFERIVAANLGLADLDDAAAFEVELGPNNCAATPSLGE